MKTSSYRIKNRHGKVRSLVAALPLALAASGAFAGVVSTLPDPVVREEDGKSVYTLGTSTSTADATYDKATAYDYIDWTSLKIPENSVIKFNGAIVLDDLPGGGGIFMTGAPARAWPWSTPTS